MLVVVVVEVVVEVVAAVTVAVVRLLADAVSVEFVIVTVDVVEIAF